jgi:hypothetical protein
MSAGTKVACIGRTRHRVGRDGRRRECRRDRGRAATADIQETTAISAGLAKAAGAGEAAAAALVKFLASPATAPAKRKTGLEPG